VVRTKPFRVLCADPPWGFGDKLPGPARGALKHYATMKTEDICAVPLPPMAADSLLFLWRVGAMQEEALRVMRAWGYVPKSEVVWVKTQEPPKPFLDSHRLDLPSARLAFGMGRYVRYAHEVCLIGARGKAAAMINDHAVTSVFFAERQEHSRKPEDFYDIVESLASGPYCELFARRARKGWTCKGIELL
jgi:N6-adenosine-specific RNA methylase IME4